MKSLVLASQQHGAGRSMAATLIARFIADRGQRVLAIDLDPQASFGRGLRSSGPVAVVSLGEDALMSDRLPEVPRERFVLVDGTGPLRGLERGQELHGDALCNLQDLLSISNRWFDACVIDTPAGPDARLHAALASAGLLLVPVRLNSGALQGMRDLFSAEGCGLQRITDTTNPHLQLVGLLPNLVDPSPGHRARLTELAALSLLIPLAARPGEYAQLPRLDGIAESVASGVMPWEMRDVCAKRAWEAIEPSVVRIADLASTDGVQA